MLAIFITNPRCSHPGEVLYFCREGTCWAEGKREQRENKGQRHLYSLQVGMRSSGSGMGDVAVGGHQGKMPQEVGGAGPAGRGSQCARVETFGHLAHLGKWSVSGMRSRAFPIVLGRQAIKVFKVALGSGWWDLGSVLGPLLQSLLTREAGRCPTRVP